MLQRTLGKKTLPFQDGVQVEGNFKAFKGCLQGTNVVNIESLLFKLWPKEEMKKR